MVDTADLKSEALLGMPVRIRSGAPRIAISKGETMAKPRADMQRLEKLRERLLADIAAQERALYALQNKLAGVDAAIAAMKGTALPSDHVPSRQRNVTRTVMEIIEEAGTKGVTAV